MSHTVPLYAVLACELLPGSIPEALLLERDATEALVKAVADDLLRLLPEVENARLILGGTLLDGAEVLRPGFAAHASLAELGLRLPHGNGGVVGIGSHQGRMPSLALQPDAQFAGSPMRYLPLVIEADPDQADALGGRLEQVLAQQGEAGANAADRIMRACGVRLAHARYLSLADLLALNCVQYEHAGFAVHWLLIEAALMSPGRIETALSPHGARWSWDGTHVALETPRAFITRTQPPPESRVNAYASAVFELRQAAALFGVHGLTLGAQADAEPGTRFVDGGIVERLAESRDGACWPASAALCLLRAPGLGVVAMLRGDPELRRAHALATPLSLDGLRALKAEMDAGLGLRSDEAALAEVDAGGVPWPARSVRH